MDASTVQHVAVREHRMGFLVTGKLGLLESFNWRESHERTHKVRLVKNDS